MMIDVDAINSVKPDTCACCGCPPYLGIHGGTYYIRCSNWACSVFPQTNKRKCEADAIREWNDLMEQMMKAGRREADVPL